MRIDSMPVQGQGRLDLRKVVVSAGRLFAVLVTSATLLGAPVTPRPDLARLYRVGTENADITPVILIPGLWIKLRDRTTGVEVWRARGATCCGALPGSAPSSIRQR
jgi:hypothetical protein